MGTKQLQSLYIRWQHCSALLCPAQTINPDSCSANIQEYRGPPLQLSGLLNGRRCSCFKESACFKGSFSIIEVAIILQQFAYSLISTVRYFNSTQISFNPQSPVVTLRNTKYNNQKFYVILTECINVLYRSHNSDYLPVQHLLTGVYAQVQTSSVCRRYSSQTNPYVAFSSNIVHQFFTKFVEHARGS